MSTTFNVADESRAVGIALEGAADAKSTRLWVTGVFLIALVAILFDVGQFVANGFAAIRYPWELDYGEGIVWEQMRLMVEGRGYGAIDGLPAIVFHYPPVYHFATAALAGATGFDQLAVGRSISFVSTLLLGLFAGLIAAKTVRAEESVRVAGICGLVAGLVTFCFYPIVYWAPFMRVDMLSIALSFGGILVAMAALTRPRLVVASAVLFVAAVFTKQTSIVAPAAVFVTFLLLRPRLAWLLAGNCMALGLIVLAALTVATDGGFVRHVFLYNVNRLDPSRLQWILTAIVSHGFFVTAAIIGVAVRLQARLPLYRGAGNIASLRQRLIAAPGDALFLMVVVYSVLAFLMMFSVAKSGSSANYFIEWMAVLAILIGISARDVAKTIFGKVPTPHKRALPHPVFVPLLIGLQAFVWVVPATPATQHAPAHLAQIETLRAMVRSAERPVISDDMVLLLRSVVRVQWEPSIFAELASTGTWDEKPFVTLVRARHFAFFITAGVRGEKLFDSRYNPAVADAMDAAYPVKRKLAGYTVHLPQSAAR